MMHAVKRQLEHHVKDKDRQTAEKTGEQPWFETMIRLANEYDRSIGRIRRRSLNVRRKNFSAAQLKSTIRRHKKACPHPDGAGNPPVLLSHAGNLLVIDGNNRINAMLASANRCQRSTLILSIKNK